MIPKFFSDLSTAVAPAVGNHIWQSTLFTCAIALLTLAFRKHRAQVRYALWLAASLKFLVPFSLLSNLGSLLASSRVRSGTPTVLSSAFEQFSQPFGEPIVPAVSQAARADSSASLTHFIPALFVVWLCGFLVVAFVWFVRWRRIRVSIRGAVPLRQGREMEALHRRQHEMPRPTEIFLSQTSLEPGVVGIARPILVWPQGVSDRLDDAHLDAVLAHELRHVRRRDNLAAALHMLVEALFWFHPLVWWMGTRLLDERERACDEEVLDSGSDRQAYAESILKICEFCVGSPLACVSGVTGADLKKRIARIMSQRAAPKLNLSRRLLLIAAALLALAAPIATGIFRAAPSPSAAQAQNTTDAVHAFATVSIAPSKSGGDHVILALGLDSFVSKNAPLQQVIRAAYGVEDDRIVGAPDWLGSEKYDLEAKGDVSATHDLRNPNFVQQVSWDKRLLQALLADHLKLAAHREVRDVSAYALVLAKGGPKFQYPEPGDTYSIGSKGPEGIARPGVHVDVNSIVGRDVPMAALLWHLSRQLHRTVLDETGLSGTYDFTLKYPDGFHPGINEPLPPESSVPIFSSALETQLGLKLEPRTAKMEVLLIDHVEKPIISQASATP